MPAQKTTKGTGFALTWREVRRQRAAMRARPVGLARPLLVLNGYRAGPWGSRRVARRLRRLTGAEPRRVQSLAYPFASSIDDAARLAIRTAKDCWGQNDVDSIPEIDVVGISMGGLVSLWAGAPPERTGLPGRLAVRRLFTIGTPHRGAALADVAALDAAARDMKPESDFLARLHALCDDEPPEIVAYARLFDGMVGATNCALPGRGVIWRQGWRPFPHLTITMDWPITLDIARRLRGERPLAPPPSEPPRD